MAIRVTSLLFLVLAAAVAELSRAAPLHSLDLTGLVNAAGEGKCSDGLIGKCIDEDEEMAMDSEANRRGLAQRFKYISYQALIKDRIPCNHRGYSYYNCNKSGARRANPYRRGCTVITHCARFLN
ncbi:protein RALF-like 19 [Wolffia australiana]